MLKRGVLIVCAAITLGHFTELSSATSPQRGGDCPPDAFGAAGGDHFPEIDWDQVGSDEDAADCIRRVAEALGPAHMKIWAESNGFAATFHPQFHEPRSILLSLGWPIRERGLLYGSGHPADLVKRFRAHSLTFGLRWRESDVTVRYGYVFE
jgi:hypothetical protein